MWILPIAHSASVTSFTLSHWSFRPVTFLRPQQQDRDTPASSHYLASAFSHRSDVLVSSRMTRSAGIPERALQSTSFLVPGSTNSEILLSFHSSGFVLKSNISLG